MSRLPSYRPLNIKEQYRKTAIKLLPCNTPSTIHDLEYGHRVQLVDARNTCGSNCMHNSHGGRAFVGAQRQFRQEPDTITCPVCTFKDVADETGINVENINHAKLLFSPHATGGLQLLSAAEWRYNKCIEWMLAQGCRRTEPVAETDNVAELVRQNPHVEVGTDDIPDMQAMMDGVVVSTEEKTVDVADSGDGLGLIWIEDNCRRAGEGASSRQ
ncbi:uncharacterized protein M421DRAFT_425717 [Didymella exigua CBS 183.55]|uniref:Uncharacterized protein n=1 Tax=Didymella exigua CBS 183.55 TaxID=1150837 RepID=A0A6A5RA06_9PLEO|nr:uncharacterized protein M421DRAFT_425717 [Didymella exigua CBS 183.55]KAF1923496.1 hypothetical protein M421DRAFT_425717 [Didymella exigua CBS 183.55]